MRARIEIFQGKSNPFVNLNLPSTVIFQNNTVYGASWRYIVRAYIAQSPRYCSRLCLKGILYARNGNFLLSIAVIREFAREFYRKI